MIKSLRHRGLRRLFENGDAVGINPALLKRVEDILTVLDAAETSADLNLPGYRLHPLKGDLKGLWSITVSGNWRVVFRFEGGNAFDVDLTDYH